MTKIVEEQQLLAVVLTHASLLVSTHLRATGAANQESCINEQILIIKSIQSEF